MVERADTLDDEGREQLLLLFPRHAAMDARRENDAKVIRGDAKLNQTPHEQVDNLRASRGARRVRDDDEHALAGANDLFERLRVKGVVNRRPDLRVRQRTHITRRRFEHLEPSLVKLKRERAATVNEFDESHD